VSGLFSKINANNFQLTVRDTFLRENVFLSYDQEKAQMVKKNTTRPVKLKNDQILLNPSNSETTCIKSRKKILE
jgi:hypothetical protein